MNDNELDKLFREQLKDQPSKPSARIWDNIEAELDRKDKKVKVLHLSWLKYAAVALAVLGTSTWWYMQQTSENTIAQQSPSVPQVIEQAHEPALTEKITKETPTIAPEKESSTLASNREKPVLKIENTLRPTKVERAEEAEKPEETKHLMLASMSLNKPNIALPEDINDGQTPKRRVVEIAPIRPLVDLSEDDTESMLAFTPAPTESVVTGILNKISDVIVSDEQKKPRFSRDEEGSFRIDFNNNFAKNRFKKRK